jgi:glycosyltransferase involved in cell wall biosynthesis
MEMMKPIAFVTGHAPPDRVGAFRALHEREGIELLLFGGRSLHGTGTRAEDLEIPHRRVRQRDLLALSASGSYRAVVVSTGGRVALPATWAGARRAGIPLILWTSLWAHPRTPAHALSLPALRRLYRTADAVVTYGPHVSAYVQARGARNVYVAPQSVDNDFWADPSVAPPGDAQWPAPPSSHGIAPPGDAQWPAPPSSHGIAPPGDVRWPAQAGFVLMFGGRAARAKGLGVLIEAWRASGLKAPAAALVLVGVGSRPPWIPAGGAVQERQEGIVYLDPVGAEQMRNFYAAADVLVLPSISTRKFREPWGLVVNEAMNRELPVIVSDDVGAAAGGLVRDGHNGLVVSAGDPAALARAIVLLAEDPALRRRLGEAGARDVSAYSHAAWAEGFAQAFTSVGVSRGRW